ncbi:hypothetical protein CASFOL_015795 [Castilleja foliolosa]|uniref:KIB1-4 beta-propeller domain-containing protein n=1 Tax=Castilleja foliolosa TaxID=1961234 RepID=A0ABD3DFP3_9LAMI
MSSIVDIPSQDNQEMKKRHVVPLLLTSDGDKQSFYSLIENRYKTISHPVLEGKRILGSAYGWLVLTNSNLLADPGDCCLWNPESRENIQLPQLDGFYDRCVLSKPPTDPDCLVVFKSYCNFELTIGRINDAEFVRVSFEDSIVAISSFRGEIYGLVKFGAYYELVTIHLVGKTVELKSLLINGKDHLEVPELWRSWVTSQRNYLIESPGGAGDFFLVIKMISSIGIRDGGEVEFRVFRLNVNGLVCVELEDLDGHTIFISDWGDGFCCPSSEMSTIKPNSIYYTNMCGRVMCVYDLDDRSITPLLPSPVARRHMSVNYWINLPGILPSIVNLLEESDSMNCRVLFSRLDYLRLERIVGSSAAKRMVDSEKVVFVFA